MHTHDLYEITPTFPPKENKHTHSYTHTYSLAGQPSGVVVSNGRIHDPWVDESMSLTFSASSGARGGRPSRTPACLTPEPVSAFLALASRSDSNKQMQVNV